MSIRSKLKNDGVDNNIFSFYYIGRKSTYTKSLHIYRKVSFYIIVKKNIVLELEFSYLSDMLYMVDMLYMIDMIYMSYQADMYYQDGMLLYVCICI